MHLYAHTYVNVDKIEFIYLFCRIKEYVVTFIETGSWLRVDTSGNITCTAYTKSYTQVHCYVSIHIYIHIYTLSCKNTYINSVKGFALQYRKRDKLLFFISGKDFLPFRITRFSSFGAWFLHFCSLCSQYSQKEKEPDWGLSVSRVAVNV